MNHTKHLYTLILVIFFAQAGFAQEQSRHIDVNGSAEMEVTPDIIKLTVNLREYEKSKKLVTLKEIESGFLKAVDGSGIADDKVVVTRVASSAYSTKRHRKAFASKTYELTFSDQKGLLNFTRRLKNADIAHMYISHLGHSQMADYRLEVKKQAVIVAKNKAEVLVEAVEATLGHVLTISEGSSFNSWAPQNNMSNMVMRQKEVSSDIEADEIGFKKIKLRFEISARFAIQ